MFSSCLLCRADLVEAFWRDKRRAYHRCPRCQLIQVPPQQRLGCAQEKAEYDLHQNAPDDEGYRGFLSRLAEPLLARLPDRAEGLDFGCGPGPALAAMLREAGHEVALYDVFYAKHESVWQRQYDFITATEVLEHLHQPRVELERLATHIRPGGYLAIMTKLSTGEADFPTWHYKNDPTHVVFFAWQTFEYLSHTWGWTLERVAKDALWLRRPT